MMVNSATFALVHGRSSIHARPIEVAANRHVPLIAGRGSNGGTGITDPASRRAEGCGENISPLPVSGSDSATGPIVDAAQVLAVSSARNSLAPDPVPTAPAYETAQYHADGR